MESVWLTTAVQMIFCTPNATSTRFKPSDHLSPSFTTVFLILAYSAFKSWSASQGLISRLHKDRWFASFLANFAMALALASSSSLAAWAFSSSVCSSSSPQKSSSSSSSAAGASFAGAAFLGAAAFAGSFFVGLGLGLGLLLGGLLGLA